MPMRELPAESAIRRCSRLALAIAYGIVGVVHLVAADKFLPIVPDWVPDPRGIILATGVCEILGAIGLVTRSLRRFAGVMLALYAVCVFPANLKHAFGHVDVPGLPSSWWYHAPRLALQPVLVWWALNAGAVIDWPFGRRGPSEPPHDETARSRRGFVASSEKSDR